MLRAFSLIAIFVAALGWAHAQARTSDLPGYRSDQPIRSIHLIDFDGDGRRDLLCDLSGEETVWRLAMSEERSRLWSPEGRTLGLPRSCGAWIPGDIAPADGIEILLLDESGARRWSPLTQPPGEASRWIDTPLLARPRQSGGLPRLTWAIDGQAQRERARVLLPGTDRDLLVSVSERGKAMPPKPVGAPTRRTRRSSRHRPFAIELTRPASRWARLTPEGPLRAVWLTPQAVRTRSPANDEILDWWPFPSDSKTSGAALMRHAPKVADLDGDGLDDLITFRALSNPKTMATTRTELFVHRGLGKPSEGPGGTLLLPGVLSSGPHLRDVDGDGRQDLWLSFTAGQLASRLQGMLGSVTLTYQLWLGRPGRRPFGRSPVLTIDDSVPKDVFTSWERRHRLRLIEDRDGDGLAELVRFAMNGKTLEVERFPLIRRDETIHVAKEPDWSANIATERPPTGFRRIGLGMPGPHLEIRWPDECRYLPLGED